MEKKLVIFHRYYMVDLQACLNLSVYVVLAVAVNTATFDPRLAVTCHA